MNKKMINAISVRVNEKPALIEFENTLENMQKYVNGYIDMIQLFDDDVDIIINDEGKIMGLPMNRILMHNDEIIDILTGDILIVGADNNSGETISIPEDKISKYLNLFSKACIQI